MRVQAPVGVLRACLHEGKVTLLLGTTGLKNESAVVVKFAGSHAWYKKMPMASKKQIRKSATKVRRISSFLED